MLLVNGNIAYAAVTMDEEESVAQSAGSYEEIMNEYYRARNEELLSASIMTIAAESRLDMLKDERNQALLDAGYMVYVTDNDNFETVQAELFTDLGEIGLDDGGKYLIVVGEGNQEDTLRSAGASFSYTYNGVTYTMRTLRVTADSDEASPRYAQASDTSVLNSSSKTVITNALNTAIYAYVSSVSSTLGTIASICGLDISRFYPNQSATMNLNAASNWTRVYTQVYSSYDKAWTYGSSVENVYCLAYMSGSYYEASTNRMTAVPSNPSSKTVYSPQYNNDTWKRQQAAIAYSSGSVCRADKTGDVQYKFGSTVKLTHYNNF